MDNKYFSEEIFRSLFHFPTKDYHGTKSLIDLFPYFKLDKVIHLKAASYKETLMIKIPSINQKYPPPDIYLGLTRDEENEIFPGKISI